MNEGWVNDMVYDRSEMVGLGQKKRACTGDKKVVRPSLVSVYFPCRDREWSYYNDQFDLNCGDLVYVDGKLEGKIGRVTKVSYQFKIKLSDYKRVVAVVDTTIRGRLYIEGSHFVAFDRAVLPSNKVLSWFTTSTVAEHEDYIYSSDDSDNGFALQKMDQMKVSSEIAHRGHQYYVENKVYYICLEGTRGYAIVGGSDIYEVEFEYQAGMIRNLFCSCYCNYNCKHEVAAMYQLSEIMEWIQEQYTDEYKQSGYFAAICKGALFTFAVDGKRKGSFTLD